MGDPTRQAALHAVRATLQDAVARALEEVADREDGPQLVAEVAHVLASRVALEAGATPEQWQRSHDVALGLALKLQGQDTPDAILPHTAHWHRPKRSR